MTDVTSESIVQRISTMVANEIDADPMELEPLYETIDPEALNRIFRADTSSETGLRSRLVFAYAGCEVTVYGNDEIEVTPLAEDQESAVVEETQSTVQSE